MQDILIEAILDDPERFASPDVVVVQLKRFDPLRRKDKHPIPFSSTLDFGSYRTVSNKTSSKYELSTVVKRSIGGERTPENDIH
jgi:hypothetical protein